MNLYLYENDIDLGKAAASKVAEVLREAIIQKGKARIVLSTGASQFSTIQALIAEDLDWSKVTMFHLDEYVGLPESHPASFRKYLKERFVSKVNLKEAVFVNGESRDIHRHIAELTERLREDEIDVGVIGIGENAHIAFNDPPADFDTGEAFVVVNLTGECKLQQVHEKWFDSVEAVPGQAITMTCRQIMQCKCIVSPVPYLVKARAIKAMLTSGGKTNEIPSTLLMEHDDFHLLLDKDSASLVNICEHLR